MFRGRRQGLTPSETLIVIALAAAFALILVWRLAEDPVEQERAETIERIELVIEALERYAIDHGGVFPTGAQGLRALLDPPSTEPERTRWRGPYLEDPASLYDAWGAPLNYVAPEGDELMYRLWSNGADRAEGGRGADADIQSWNRNTMVP